MAEQGVIAHLVVKDVAAALEFYRKALGATETMRMPEENGTRLLHAEMIVNGAKVYLVDDFPEHRDKCSGGKIAPPGTLGGTTMMLHLDVPNCDAAVRRAAEAGATVIMPPWDAFWGARYAQVLDPFGHAWSFAHPLPSASR